MESFVSFDFETANEKRVSACSVGLAKFDETGVLVDTYSSFILPHKELRYFNPVNTWTHGLSLADVEAAPEWSEIYPEVEKFIGELPLVAHNVAFDGYVLSDLANLYEIKPLENRRICTLRIARSLLSNELTSRKLPDVFRYYFPGEEFSHHEATSDAIAAGRIFSAMQKDNDFDSLCSVGVAGLKQPSRHKIAANVQTPETASSVESLIEFYGDNPLLEGENISITGTLKRGKRADIQKRISHLGGSAEKSLTKRTSLLVVGIPNPQRWKPGAAGSAKLTRASELRDQGAAIEVLSEEDFFRRIDEIYAPMAL